MNESLFINIIIGISIASVPLIFAAIGELLVERSGVLNLGVEGMMIVGALLGFVVMSHTQNPYLAVLSAMLGGLVIASIFAFLTHFLLTNPFPYTHWTLPTPLYGYVCAAPFHLEK